MTTASIIDSNVGHPALVYLHGHDNIIPGLEKGLEGASLGDRRKVDVQPADAYGDFDPDAVFELARDEFPEEMPLEEGMQFCAETPGGEMAITVDRGQRGHRHLRREPSARGHDPAFRHRSARRAAGSDEELQLGQAVA